MPWRKASRQRCSRARLLQLAFYLAVIATTANFVAITLNWRNDHLGFWLNAIIIGVTDVPFVLFILLPGYTPWWPRILTPVLWVVGCVCTAAARLHPRLPGVIPHLAR